MFLSHPGQPQWEHTVSQMIQQLSPLYQAFSEGMDHDHEIKQLSEFADPLQPKPITFFSMVNFLVLEHPDHHLAHYYPCLTAIPLPAHEAYAAFRSFCLEHREELQQILPTARLQTNEVTRCANLLPAFAMVAERGDHKPLALVEIGASAGLNQWWDRYGYGYTVAEHSTHLLAGERLSPVQIECTLTGPSLPPLPQTMPMIASRIGIDLFPLDIRKARDVHWLQACIWPEELYRYTLLRHAITYAKNHIPRILTGDACEVLPAVLALVPQELTLCLYHSYALTQGPAPIREKVFQIIRDASHHHNLYRISLETKPGEWSTPRLELFTYQNGQCVQEEWLATCSIHGDQMTWLT